MKVSHKYDDIIYLPHHQSTRRPHMSLYNRAAQFSPFAALTGYDAEIAETGRLTTEEKRLDENARELLDQKLMMIMERMPQPISYQFTYFLPDSLKEGGSYQTATGVIKRINTTAKTILLYDKDLVHDGLLLPIQYIIDIQGEGL